MLIKIYFPTKWAFSLRILGDNSILIVSVYVGRGHCVSINIIKCFCKEENKNHSQSYYQ